MLDPSALYQFETDTDVTFLHARTMVVAFGGYLDAGGTQRLLVDHLLSTLDHRVVATFDVDQLFDYRGRRPLMTFERDRFTAYDDPALVLYAVTDDSGTPFLLLAGREPDYQWERMIEAVQQLMLRFGVELVVTVYGVPMTVPHTRPLWVSAHANNERLVEGRNPVFGTVKVPAGLQNLLEFRLGEAAKPAVGYAVHVPHYLAHADFPAAALAGLENLVEVTGLDLPDAALQAAASDTQRAITAEVGDNEEAQPVITALEQQYDDFVAGRQRQALLAGDDSLIPSGEQLAEEFEEFLRQQEGDAQPKPPEH